MSKYLQNIAANNLNPKPAISPRTPALYEPSVETGFSTPPDNASKSALPRYSVTPPHKPLGEAHEAVSEQNNVSNTPSPNPESAPSFHPRDLPSKNSQSKDFVSGNDTQTPENIQLFEETSSPPSTPRSTVQLPPQIVTPHPPSIATAGTPGDIYQETLQSERSTQSPLSSPPTSPLVNASPSFPTLTPSLNPSIASEESIPAILPPRQQPPPQNAPTINVTIGHVEVRASTPKSSTPKTPKISRPPKRSLDDYLQTRSRSSTSHVGG